jgi:hypothetical protein
MKKLLPFAFIFTVTFSFSQTQIGNSLLGTGSSDFFGFSTCLSSDGNVLAVGIPLDDNANGTNSGGVKVFENNNGVWEQIGDDIFGEASNDLSGSSISLSADGSTVAIGATDNEGNGIRSGHVRVYRNNNGSWIKLGQDLDGESSENISGHSVGLSSDGNIVAIGAPYNSDAGTFIGHVRVYRNNNGTWEQIGDDIDGEMQSGFNNSGWSIDLSSDGNIVAIGAPLNDSVDDDSGHVRVYRNNNGIWEQIGDDIDGILRDDETGAAVSLSADGRVVTSNFGSKIKVFENNNNVWEQLGNDIDAFVLTNVGSPLSLSSDGNIIVIGEARNSDNGNSSGRARIYQLINSVWVQVGTDINGDENNAELGFSVSISLDGSKVSVGSPFFDGNNSNIGQVKVYDLTSVLSVTENLITSLNLYPNPTSSQFTIQLDQNVQLKKVNIYNQLGQLLKSVTTHTVDTHSFASGIYFVEITTDRGKSTKKLIIN